MRGGDRLSLLLVFVGGGIGKREKRESGGGGGSVSFLLFSSTLFLLFAILFSCDGSDQKERCTLTLNSLIAQLLLLHPFFLSHLLFHLCFRLLALLSILAARFPALSEGGRRDRISISTTPLWVVFLLRTG